MDRRTTIMSFSQEEYESLPKAWEIFKQLLCKCLNHNIKSMEQLTQFISGLTTPTRMFLDASTRGTLRTIIDDEAKTLIENTCQDEYHSSKQGIK